MKLVGSQRRNFPIRELEIEIDRYETGGVTQKESSYTSTPEVQDGEDWYAISLINIIFF